MAGELPNSFIKQQLDIPSGAAARGRVAGRYFRPGSARFDFGLMLALIAAYPCRGVAPGGAHRTAVAQALQRGVVSTGCEGEARVTHPGSGARSRL
jgi:hypothetical protein